VNSFIRQQGGAPVDRRYALQSANDRVRLDQLADLSIPSGAFTNLLLSRTVRYDNNGMAVAGSTQVFCRTAGLFAISAGVVFNVTAGGLQRILRIVLNNAFVLAEQTLTPIAGGASGTFINISTQAQLIVGDFITFDCYQDSGGAFNALGSTTVGHPITHGAMALIST
jgi:hypothetical protein